MRRSENKEGSKKRNDIIDTVLEIMKNQKSTQTHVDGYEDDFEKDAAIDLKNVKQLGIGSIKLKQILLAYQRFSDYSMQFESSN